MSGIEGDGAEPVGHAVSADHLARHGRRALDVVRSAGGDIAEDQLLRRAAAQQRDNLAEQIRPGEVRPVLVGQGDGHAARLSARDDRDLVDRVVVGQSVHHDGVARLVIRRQAALMLRNDAAVLLGPGDDLDDGLIEQRHVDRGQVAPTGEQRRLVEQVLQIRAGEARRAPGDLREVDVLGEGLVARVDGEDLLAALDIRQADIDLPVKAARAQERGVEDVDAVRRGEDDNALVRGEAVHLDEQLVERLLALVVAAAEAAAALAADGVDLVDEDDGRSVLLGLREEVAHAARADADVHLHKVGAGDGEELHPGLTGHGTREQRFARAGRADEQDALWDVRAEAEILLRIAQELHDLLQLLLLLVRARDVAERSLSIALAGRLDAGLAEAGHLAVHPAARVAGHEVHQQDERQNRQHIRQQQLQPVCRVVGVVVIVGDDAARALLLDELVEIVIEQVEAVEVAGGGRAVL